MVSITYLKDFHEYLDSQHPAVQFTNGEVAAEEDAFLDVSMERKPESFVTSVYKKPTHTDQYINLASHHHPWTKLGVSPACREEQMRSVIHTEELGD